MELEVSAEGRAHLEQRWALARAGVAAGLDAQGAHLREHATGTERDEWAGSTHHTLETNTYTLLHTLFTYTFFHTLHT